MAEQVVNGYKRLFEVRVLHHYWLDEGDRGFDSLPKDAAERASLPIAEQKLPTREQRLLAYDMRKLFAVAPTESTVQQLKGLRCVFKTTALGFVVAVPAQAVIPDDALFEFALTVQDAGFFNYTALTLRKQNIYESFYAAGDKIYRFKENVFVFSNRDGVAKTLHPAGEDVLFLSQPIPLFSGTATYPIESVVEMAGPVWYRALGDQPSAAPPSTDWQEMADAALQPVFVHQNDVPPIVLPAGMTAPPDRGIELSTDLPDDIFALIRIEKLAAAAPLGLMGASTFASPVFEIRFRNRSTIWKYYDKRVEKTESPDNALSVEPNPLPLTFYGNANQTQKMKPSAGLVKASFDNVIKTKVTGLVSEIFE